MALFTEDVDDTVWELGLKELLEADACGWVDCEVVEIAVHDVNFVEDNEAVVDTILSVRFESWEVLATVELESLLSFVPKTNAFISSKDLGAEDEYEEFEFDFLSDFATDIVDNVAADVHNEDRIKVDDDDDDDDEEDVESVVPLAGLEHGAISRSWLVAVVGAAIRRRFPGLW